MVDDLSNEYIQINNFMNIKFKIIIKIKISKKITQFFPFESIK